MSSAQAASKPRAFSDTLSLLHCVPAPRLGVSARVLFVARGREAPCGSYRKTRISGRLVRNRDYVACLDRTSPQIIVRDPRKARGRVTIRPELSSSDRVKIDNCSKLGGCLVVPFSPQPSVFGFAGGKHCGLGNLFGRKYRCVSSRVKKAPRGYPVPFSSDENWDSPQVL